ncbi:DUF3445 domain-containing protein [Cognatishimia sp. F0-27]|uniref:heme-dependent oxidative N-demethylase family protein n=1 Tax=Cognatishimia sp. F0-27 TaxID=2816855 RepID=UPI001D0C29BF|nr:DUF3445 domain-containing protein [Cognatishimia sp. F0-27]MCC1493398.1 DUF3445 domain-containing protein [Cognatishimia sp. F0-27]
MILQESLPYDALTERALPGIQPMDPQHWLQVDDAYGAQMQERARLIAERPRDVLYLDEAVRPAAEELFDTVIGALPQGFLREGDAVIRPDGIRLTPDRSDPMRALGLLVQEDLVLMIREAGETEHRLRAAVLCFPSRWRLREKAGRALVSIHDPVARYGADVAKRVQRLFDGVQPGRPLWRYNGLWHDDASLYQPQPEQAQIGTAEDPDRAPFFRTERQGIVRLPVTRAVVFSIHTYVLTRARIEALQSTRITA